MEYVPYIKETCENVKLLLQRLKYDEHQWMFSYDSKVCCYFDGHTIVGDPDFLAGPDVRSYTLQAAFIWKIGIFGSQIMRLFRPFELQSH